MIICFSGTGNTFYVASKLAERRRLDIFMLEGARLLKPSETEIETESPDEIVIWAFPTYSWGIPPVVVDFIEKFKAGEGLQSARHYMLTTCGDDMGQTDYQWRKIMKNRGFKAVSAFSVIMPNIYVCMKGFDVDDPDLVRSKIDAVDSKLDRIVDSIENGGSDILTPGAFAWIKSKIIYPWFIRHEMSPKSFRPTNSCTGCGTCSKLCPMENIRMTQTVDKTTKPEWGSQCAMCLRCYHVCPHHAVAYGHKTDGKGRQWTGFRNQK